MADSPRRFALSFFGIIDLIAILPFYLSLGVDLRSIRVLRVLRLLRIIRVGRYMQALDRLQRAGRMVREELVLATGKNYSFKGGRWSGRFPVTMIGKEGLTLEDFEPARVAAERLARERSPEDFN